MRGSSPPNASGSAKLPPAVSHGTYTSPFTLGLLSFSLECVCEHWVRYISTSLANSIVFAVLIVVLLVKPTGLLGKYVPEKV